MTFFGIVSLSGEMLFSHYYDLIKSESNLNHWPLVMRIKQTGMHSLINH